MSVSWPNRVQSTRPFGRWRVTTWHRLARATDPRRLDLAEAYGAAGFRAERPEELHQTLATALNHKGVAVIDVAVSKEENVFPIVPAGKSIGEMMVTDHAKANANLTKVATAKGVKLPDKLDKKHAMMVDKMTKLSGKEFDTAYVSEMVEDHKKDVAEFEKAANELSDPDLKAFAKETLPTLKKHLEKIEQIRDAKK